MFPVSYQLYIIIMCSDDIPWLNIIIIYESFFEYIRIMIVSYSFCLLPWFFRMIFHDLPGTSGPLSLRQMTSASSKTWVTRPRRWRANLLSFFWFFRRWLLHQKWSKNIDQHMNGKNERLWYESVRSIDGSKKMTLSNFCRSIDGSCFKHLPSSSIYLSIHINSYRFIYLWLRLFPIVPPLPDQASVWPTAVEMLKSSRHFSTRWRWRALRCWEAETKIYRAVENPHHV
jgi:hypothetical protein